MREAVIVAYGRSPVCRAMKGALAGNNPIDWSAQVLNGVLAKVPQLDLSEISDVVVGCAMPVKYLNLNVARLIVLRAGLPFSVCGQTVNRFCASSLQTLSICANAIVAGGEDVMVAGGVEDMTNTFHTALDSERNQWLVDNVKGAYIHMGDTAENVAERYKVKRVDMERMSVASHAKAAAAQDNGGLNRSIIPVTVTNTNGETVTVSLDEGIRRGTNMEKLATLKPCFKEDGVVTAATSSQSSDGAAFAVLMSSDKAKELGVKPIAKLVAYATGGCDGAYMGLGPIYAVPKAMKRANMTYDDIDVIEINEAFAAQALTCIRELKLPEEKVNP